MRPSILAFLEKMTKKQKNMLIGLVLLLGCILTALFLKITATLPSRSIRGYVCDRLCQSGEMLSSLSGESVESLGNGSISEAQIVDFFVGSKEALGGDKKLTDARLFIRAYIDDIYKPNDISVNMKDYDGKGGFSNVSEAFKYLQDTAGIHPDVAAALSWADRMLEKKGVEDLDSQCRSLIRLLSDECTNTEIKNVAKELYLVCLEHMFDSGLPSSLQYWYDGEDILKYVQFSEPDLQRRAIKVAQEDLSPEMAGALVSFAQDNNCIDVLTSSTFFRSCIKSNGAVDSVNLFSLMMKYCFLDGKDDGRAGECIEMASSYEEFNEFRTKFSQLWTYFQAHTKLFDEGKYFFPFEFTDSLNLYESNPITEEMAAVLCLPDCEPAENNYIWDEEELEKYYGDSYRPSAPVKACILNTRALQLGYSCSLSSDIFEEAGLRISSDPDEAIVLLKEKSSYYQYYGQVKIETTTRTTEFKGLLPPERHEYSGTNPNYYPAFSCITEFELVNCLTGDVIGTYTSCNHPTSGSDFLLKPNEQGEESVYMEKCRLTISELQRLVARAMTIDSL